MNAATTVTTNATNDWMMVGNDNHTHTNNNTGTGMQPMMDSERTQVLIFEPLTNAKARQYGQGLAGNTVVETLLIFDGRALMNNHDNNDNNDNHDNHDDDDLNLLLKFIADSPSLQILEITSMHRPDVVSRFVQAASQSTSLREVRLCDMVMTTESLATLVVLVSSSLSSSSSIHKMALNGITLLDNHNNHNNNDNDNDNDNNNDNHVVIVSNDNNKNNNNNITSRTTILLEELELGSANDEMFVALIDWFQTYAPQITKSLSLCPTNDAVFVFAHDNVNNNNHHNHHLGIMNPSLSHSIQRFLQSSSPTLQRLELKYFNFDAATFQPIQTGILFQCPSLTKLSWIGGNFVNQEATTLFQQMFSSSSSPHHHRTNKRIQYLSLGGRKSTRFHTSSLSSILAHVIQNGNLIELSLADLHFRGRNQLDFAMMLQPLISSSSAAAAAAAVVVMPQQPQQIQQKQQQSQPQPPPQKSTTSTLTLTSSSSSTLHHLHLGTLTNPREARELFVLIPKLQGLFHISFQVTDGCLYDTTIFRSMKSTAIQAFRRNCSIQGCHATIQSFASKCLQERQTNSSSSDDEESLSSSLSFAEQDYHTKLEHYCQRNQYICQSIANPEAKPIQNWPRLLKSALDYEYRHDVIFQALLALTPATTTTTTTVLTVPHNHYHNHDIMTGSTPEQK